MTEPSIRDLADGIKAERDALSDWEPRLRAIAARLRESGFDHEAAQLEAQALRRKVGIDAIATLADGMLDDTQVELDLALVGSEAHADDE